MSGRRDEVRYLSAAVPVRLVTEGTNVALALAAAIDLHDVAIAGALIAVFTAPSVVAAPLIGALIDAVPSPKRAMLGASVLTAAVLAVAAFLPVVPLPLVFVALLAGGCALPVFMGGLSSFVDDAMPGSGPRGFAVDALAYNIAGIGGPALVSVAAALLSPTGALLALAVVALAGGLLLQTLPMPARGASAHPADLARGIAAATRHLLGHGPLTRATAAGTLSQLGSGGLPVIAVLIALARGTSAAGGGWLLTAFAIGGITGAVLVTVPRISARLAAIPARLTMAVGFTLTGLFQLVAAVVPGYPLTFAAFVLAGLWDAPAVAAMLRIRQEESPGAVRAQVFVVGSGLRVAASSIGSALAGALTGLPAPLLLALAALPWIASAPILLLGRPTPQPAEA
ncbi:MFS transporter [Amnibacterium sp. CER49]|uniref:MFS transporter n=1 Tax=Amnibacterium sp. CER49 TaxID=3039161 RepID=UPI002449FFCF|nr:MFS transporter [Amnibacterium sp. CER49]MDH2444226.1 MFS transporter [Amnibacterium sp. CER49]